MMFLPFLALLSLCGTVGAQSKRCFRSNFELREAVQAYIHDTLPNATIANTYGFPIGSWCVSPLQDFSGVFQCATNFNEDIGAWDVSKAVTMRNLFRDATAFNQSLENWNVANVQDMYGIFDGAESFQQDLSQWNVSKVTDLSRAFRQASNFNSNISAWDISNVRSLRGTFQEATAFNQSLGHWNVSSVVNFRSTFKRAKTFDQNLCAWADSILGKSSVELYSMFKYSGCPVRSTPFISPNQVGPLCHYCSELPCNEDPMNDCLGFTFGQELRSAIRAYTKDASKRTTVAASYGWPIAAWNTSCLEDFSWAFFNNYWFDENIADWNTSKAVTMVSMFEGATFFEGEGLSEWDVSNLQFSRNMFKNAVSFQSDISGWNLSSLIHSDGMFLGASRFNHSLCAWAQHFPNDCTLGVDAMFALSGCPEHSSPSMNGLGPYCHTCPPVTVQVGSITDSPTPAPTYSDPIGSHCEDYDDFLSYLWCLVKALVGAIVNLI